MNVRYLKIGSWNIEHFGRENDENNENQYAIAQHIELADVDIIALQELYVTEDDICTYVKGHNAPFDRIFVPRGEDRKPFLYSRQYILCSASPLSRDRYLSDHYIIKTMVKIRRDDD